MRDPLQSKHCPPKINQRMLALLQERTSLPGFPPQPDPTAPQKRDRQAPGWAGRGQGRALQPARGGGAGLEKAFAAGEKGSLVQCQEQESLRAAFVQEEKMMAAGSVASHLPAQAAPVFLLPQSDHLGWGAQGGP